VAVERLQKLDALLLPDREFVDERVGVDREAELVGERANLLRRLPQVYRDGGARFRAEHDVLGHGHRVHQHEVLVHHADAEPDGVVRRLNVPRLAVHHDFARVGRVEAIGDAHHRRLPRPILAHDGVNRPRLDLDVDVVVGEHVAEPLGDGS
jgi:hypothetical protein